MESNRVWNDVVGEEEPTLTDGAMDPGGDVGADDWSTEDEDEIGLIFKLEGKETKYA